MKITISTQDLKEALNISQNTLGSSSDITSHFIFHKEGTGASVLSCSPPRTFSKIPLLGATVVDEGDFSLDGKRTLKAISAVSGVLNVEHTESESSQGEVSFKAEKGSLTLNSLNPESFPPWLDKLNEAEGDKEVSANVLYDTFNTLKSYISNDDGRRPELAMLVVEEGKAYACDGFGLALARHNDFNGLNLKVHFKDINPLLKFLKAHEGQMIKMKSGAQATFYCAEEGAVFGTMDLPYTFPSAVSTQYAEAFDWVPRRVWRITKDSVNSAINFLSAGADATDFKITLSHSEGDLLPPRMEMRPSSGKGNLSYNLEVPPFEHEETPLDQIENPGEKMYASRQREKIEGGDIESFSFNYQYMKRALDTSDPIITFGCNQEGTKGYMVFKENHASGVETVSIVGWMI
jgi:hypothetical protein